MKRLTILFILIQLSVTALHSQDLNTGRRIEIDSLMKDSLILSNLLQDLYFNKELRDSLIKERELIKGLTIKEINNCDTLITEYENKDLIKEEKIKELSWQNENLLEENSRLEFKNKIKNKLILIGILIPVIILITNKLQIN